MEPPTSIETSHKSSNIETYDNVIGGSNGLNQDTVSNCGDHKSAQVEVYASEGSSVSSTSLTKIYDKNEMGVYGKISAATSLLSPGDLSVNSLENEKGLNLIEEMNAVGEGKNSKVSQARTRELDEDGVDILFDLLESSHSTNSSSSSSEHSNEQKTSRYLKKNQLLSNHSVQAERKHSKGFSSDVTSRLVSTINSISKTAKTGTELPALSDYSVNLDHSYGTDSDVSSLPDDDIVSDNDEFVDAIQSHYQLRGLLSEIELDSSSSSSEDIYSHSEGSEGNDVDDYADETDNEEGGRGGERINRKEQFRFGRTPYSPRMSRRFSFKKSRNLSSFKTKLSFRKQAVRSAEALDTDFPRRGSKNKIQNQDLENKSEQSLQDFESASVSTMSSKSISASTISTFFPPVPLGEPISYFPTSFTSQHPNPLSMYFDQQMIEHGVPKNMMSNFYSEHVIFLRAVLQLLSEREKVGVEAAADDPNTIKTGPLKKKMSLRKGKGGFGRLGWKMKYVEIRKGLFSYYENSKDSGGELLRKNLSLRANLCSCRSVPKMDQGNNGFVFELINESGTSTTWLSNSREERAAWIRAINEAMIGKSPAQRDINVVDDFESVVTPSSRRDLLQKTPSLRDSISSLFTSQESPSEEKDYDQYHEVKKQVLNATSKESYLSAFDSLWGNSLSIPFRLLKTQPEASNHAVISQLWKQLSRESYSINGHMLQGDTEYGPERILGGLTRCILEYDKIYRDPSFSDNDFSLSISEIQAISYARDILAACSSVGLGKCFSCVEQLCLSPNLALLIPSSSEIIPIKIIVSLFDADSKFAPKIISKERGNEQEKNGWLTTRNRNQKNWRKLFCVLSEGVLSYYEKHYPRPHLLKGQFILVGANIRVSEIKIRGKNDKGDAKGSAQTRHIIRLATANDSKERLFVFEDKEEFFSWKLALKNAIKLCSPSVDTSSASENEETECKEGMDENKDRSMQKKNFADLFRGAVQRGSVNNISSFTHDLVGEIQRTMAIPPLKDAKIISRLRSRNIANENTVWAETGNRDFHATTDSLRIQLKKPLLQVFKGINTSSESTLKNDVTLQEQKPSLMVNLEAMTVYKICSFMKSEGDLSNDTWGMVQAKFQKSFHLSGGINGKLEQGEEVIQMNFLKGSVDETAFETET